MDETDYVVITAGSFDLLIEVVCQDDAELLEILGRVRAIPSVTAAETFVYLKLCKQTYIWKAAESPSQAAGARDAYQPRRSIGQMSTTVPPEST